MYRSLSFKVQTKTSLSILTLKVTGNFRYTHRSTWNISASSVGSAQVDRNEGQICWLYIRVEVEGIFLSLI